MKSCKKGSFVICSISYFQSKKKHYFGSGGGLRNVFFLCMLCNFIKVQTDGILFDLIKNIPERVW